jgi:hypothetical protein
MDLIYVYVWPCMYTDVVLDLSMSMYVRLDVIVFMDDFYMLMETRLD